MPSIHIPARQARNGSITATAEVVLDFGQLGERSRLDFVRTLESLVCAHGWSSFTAQALHQVGARDKLPMIYPLQWNFSVEDLENRFPSEVAARLIGNLNLLGFKPERVWSGYHAFRFDHNAANYANYQLKRSAEETAMRRFLPLLRTAAITHIIPRLSYTQDELRKILLHAAQTKDQYRFMVTI